MLYRKLGNTPFEVSEVGVGCRGLIGRNLEGMNEAVNVMEEMGVNFIDLYSPNPEFRHYMGRAVMNRRDRFIIQAHIGPIWRNGEYHYSRILSEVEKGFSDQLRTLATGHVEVGLIHNIENPQDLDMVLNGDLLTFARKLKEFGTIGAIGMSVHDAQTALLAAKSGAVETLMFAANVYTDKKADDDSLGFEVDPVRAELYDYCEKNGIGLSLMNVFKGGELLDAEKSPIHRELSVHQCLGYALSIPAVASAMCSALDSNELREACAYQGLSDKEKESIVKSLDYV